MTATPPVMGSVDADALPITALIPDSATSCIELYDRHAALKIAVVERDGVPHLGADWDVPGVYVLLDRPDADGTWGVYAGKAPAGIKSRLQSHLRNKDHWQRAVLVTKDSTHGFNSAEVGWLEGRLYDLFAVAEAANLHNANRPSDETLPQYDRSMLEMLILPLRRVLRLLGYDPATSDDTPTEKKAAKSGRAKQRYYGVKLSEIVTAGLLEPDTELVSTNNASPGSAVVTAAGEVVVNGVSYASPSTAAAVVRGGASNGWEFWAVETPTGRVTLAVLRDRYRKQRDTAPN